MQAKNWIEGLTVLLAFCAGFCDATTFVAAHSLLSASITGNLVVFAVDVAHHADAHTWVKLGSFPVFVLALVTARAVARRTPHLYLLLVLEGGLLLAAGLLALASASFSLPGALKIVALAIVFAMGLHNAFSTLAGQQVLGPTTVMTGKLTQLVFAGVELNDSPAPDAASASRVSLQKQAPIFGAFLVGCLAGAHLATWWGLVVVVVPGMLLLAGAWISRAYPVAAEVQAVLI
jgi:uncharacterized membrane protein YoaK (UPF0700 family)